MSPEPGVKDRTCRPIVVAGILLLAVALGVGVTIVATGTPSVTAPAVATIADERDGTGAVDLAVETGDDAGGEYRGAGEASVTVAVVDTGINDTHPDLQGRVTDRIDLTKSEPIHPATGTDVDGHGTYMAGIVAGAGAAGEHAEAAPDVKLVDIRILKHSGDRNVGEKRVRDGVEYAVTEADADVVLLSLDSVGSAPEIIESTVEWARERGVLVVASAGNRHGPRRITTPGTSEAALTVGATDGTDRALNRGSTGPTLDGRFKPDLLAPGAGITGPRAGYGSGDETTRNVTRTGTSVSAAVVAGAGARLLASEPGLSPTAVERRLKSTARPLTEASGYGAASGVVDPDRARNPDIVTDGVVDLGVISDDRPVTQTVTLENHGREHQALRLDTDLDNLDTGTSVDDALTVNRSRITLDPGEEATIEIRVDGGIPSGAYAGTIGYTIDSESRSIAVGFVRGGKVTVEKRSLSPGDRVDGNELLVFTEDDTHTELLDFEDGTASFVAGGGTYVLWSAGIDEPTGSLILLSERLRVDGDTHVVLDEAETTPIGVDADALVEAYGPLENRSVSASMVTRKGDSTQRLSRLVRDADTRTIRASPDRNTSVTTAYLLTTPAEGGTLDSSDVFHLSSHHRNTQWTSPREVRPRDLETTEYRFSRTTIDRTPEVQERATVRGTDHDRQLSWFDIGNRSVQTVHRTPEIDHERHLRADGWRAQLAAPNQQSALSHPFIARADISVDEEAATITAQPLADGAGTELHTAGEHAVTVAVDGEVIESRSGTDPVVRIDDLPLAGNRSADGGVAAGRELTVRINGSNADGRLSTWTRGEVILRADDIDPEESIPMLRDVRVSNITPTSAAGPGSVPIRFETETRNSIASATVWHAVDDVTAPPWQNATAWNGRPTRFGHDGLRTVVNASADAETISLAIEIRTDEGSLIRAATADAFHVDSAPNTSTRLIHGQLETAAGEPAANDTVVATPVDGESPIVGETDGEGYIKLEVPKETKYDVHYRRGDLWTGDRSDDRSRPDFHTLGRIDTTSDVSISRTLPDPTRLNVVVRDERGVPAANATVSVAHRVGNVSTGVELETDANGTVDLGATDDIVIGAINNRERPVEDLVGGSGNTTVGGGGNATVGLATDDIVEITVTAPDEHAFVDETVSRMVALPGGNVTEEFTLETAPPTAAVSTSRTWMMNGTPTTLDASESDVPAGPAEYRWDLTGDGTTDRVTDEPEIRYQPAVGVSKPTVIVFDAAGKRDTASTAAITVTE